MAGEDRSGRTPLEPEGRGFFSRLARRNLDFNRGFEPQGPVNGQRLPPVGELRYGLGHVARSGCGLIAVYNALTLLGDPRPLSEVIYWGDRRARVALGLFGTRPGRGGALFRRLGWAVTKTGGREDLDRAVREGEVCLFTYWNHRRRPHRGIHTVCLRRVGTEVEVYNLSGASPQAARKASMAAWTAQGIRPIVLYAIRPPAHADGPFG